MKKVRVEKANDRVEVFFGKADVVNSVRNPALIVFYK
jgi:hypothetical protein